MKLRTLTLVAVGGLAVLLATYAIRNESGGSPQDVANRVSGQVMSPFCPGVTLHDCPSEKATELRAEIAGWAADGASVAEIVRRLEHDYGAQTIRAAPSGRGAGVIVWLLPFAAAVGGGAVAWWAARRWTESRVVPSRDHRALSTEERARLAAELGRLRAER